MKMLFKSLVLAGFLDLVGSMVFAEGSRQREAIKGPDEVNYAWNQLHTGAYEAMIAETVAIRGYNNDLVRAYYSRPLGDGPYPGIILISHMPGWDEMNREVARRLTSRGYAVIVPDIYYRFGQGPPAESGV